MKAEIWHFCDHVLSATINGVYQGIVLTLLLACGLRLLGRTNAATRHAVWLVMLLLVAALLPAHYFFDEPRAASKPVAAQIERPSALGSQPQPSVGAAQESILPAVAQGHSTDDSWDFDETIVGTEDYATAEESLPNPTAVRAANRQAANHVAPGASHGAFWPRVTGIVASAGQWLRVLWVPLNWNISGDNPVAKYGGALFLTAWVLLAGLRLVVLLVRLVRLRHLKTDSFPPSVGLQQLFESTCASFQLKRQVELRISTTQRTPVLVGFFHPVVLLPAAEAQMSDPVETEQILRHELAHVHRRDDWINLLQNGVQSFLFFHPAVWWSARELALAREIAADDCVLVGSPPRAYALVLANLANRIYQAQSPLAPGISTNRNQLQQRISMILNTRRNASAGLARTRMGFITSVAALAALLAFYCGPRLVLAQTATTLKPGDTPATAQAANVAPVATAPMVVALSGRDKLQVPTVVTLSAPVTARAPVVLALSTADGTPAPEPVPAMPPVAPSAKSKPGEVPDALTAPALPGVIMTAPAPALPPTPRYSPVPPGAQARLAPPEARRLRDRSDADTSVEERLSRLERLVESLMAGQHAKNVSPEIHVWSASPGRMAAVEGDMAGQKEAAKRAEQDARRAEEDARRAGKHFEAMTLQQQDMARAQMREASQKQLEALRHARESLSRELEKLDGQIQQLQQQREQLQKDREQRGKIKEDKLFRDKKDLTGKAGAGSEDEELLNDNDNLNDNPRKR